MCQLVDKSGLEDVTLRDAAARVERRGTDLAAFLARAAVSPPVAGILRTHDVRLQPLLARLTAKSSGPRSGPRAPRPSSP
ncbi:hypothetical protein [Streptomyces angustmyceticus]|uniref:hypothetical protein n=1 Tax=Streptomyces angustmyceticus TaxID=285578 RepID=UPI0038011397